MNKYKNKPKRIYLDDHYYFVTVKTQLNKPIFKNHHNAKFFSLALMFLKNRGDFELAAGVLLPDHFHLLLLPIKKNISAIMHDLKSYTSQQINNQRRGILASPEQEGETGKGETGKAEAESLTYGGKVELPSVWQRSFYYHIITTDLDFENHYNYIVYNPQKHGYVSNYDDWPWLWYKFFNNLRVNY